MLASPPREAPTRPVRSTPSQLVERGLLELTTAGLLAIDAFDPERWVRGWIFAVAHSIGLILAALSLGWTLRAIGRDHRSAVAAPPGVALTLLAAWLVWAAVGPGAFSTAVQFAVVCAALATIAATRGSIPVARTIGLGLLAHLGAAALTCATTSIDAVVDGRLTLVSLEANELARIGAVGAVAGAHLLLRGRLLDRVVGLGISSVGGVTVVLTGSRTALAALALGLAVLFLLEAPRWVLLGAIAAGLLALPVAASLTPGDLPVETAIDRSTEGIGSFNGRQNLWPRLLDATDDVRVAGVGLGNARDFIKAEVPTGWNAQHAHNLVLHVLVTTGVVGVALLGAALGWSLLRAASRPAGEAGATLALAMIAVVGVEGVTEAVLRTPSFGWAAVVTAAALSAPPGTRDA